MSLGVGVAFVMMIASGARMSILRKVCSLVAMRAFYLWLRAVEHGVVEWWCLYSLMRAILAVA